MSTDALLSRLQRDAFSYFKTEINPANGLVKDKSTPDSACSIAAVGFAVASFPVAVERGLMRRSEAVERTLAALRFFWNSPQGDQPDATGYKGFYYHFLDMKAGRRVWECELSTIDTALLLAGGLVAAAYFQGSGPEAEIRDLANKLYLRVDWRWAQNGDIAISQGWTPEKGFLRTRWGGYNEALLLYMLALGSPTHPVSEQAYKAWCDTYKLKKIYGHELVYAGSLFIHQFSHIWIDFRGIMDEPLKHSGLGIDYFENSRRATYVQQQYAIRNPRGFAGYSEHCWGISASDGPGPTIMNIDGKQLRLYGYMERGVPYGPDDGTLSPTAMAASLPFAPEIVLPSIEYLIGTKENSNTSSYPGYLADYNPTFPEKSGGGDGWVCPWHLGIEQGPVVLMIENYRSELIWQLMRTCPYVVEGLRRAGFRPSSSAGGWLTAA